MHRLEDVSIHDKVCVRVVFKLSEFLELVFRCEEVMREALSPVVREAFSTRSRTKTVRVSRRYSLPPYVLRWPNTQETQITPQEFSSFSSLNRSSERLTRPIRGGIEVVICRPVWERRVACRSGALSTHRHRHYQIDRVPRVILLCIPLHKDRDRTS